MADDGASQEATGGVVGSAVPAAEFERFEHITVGTLYMAFAIGGVLSNALLILTILKDKGLFRGTSWLHVSLALANIGVVAPSPFPASSSFSGRWLYGDTVCKAYAFEGMFIGITAIGCVICLCVERYVITARKEAMQTNSTPFYWAATLINLGNALFWACMPLLGWSRYSLDHTGTSCAINWKNPDEGYMSYMATLSTFSFTLPTMGAFLALYKSIPATSASGSASASGSTSGAGSSGEEASATAFTEAQLRWLCLIFLVLVLVGWGPFALLCVWAMVGNTSSVSMLAATLPPLACKFCTMLYPFAYNVASPRLRAGYFSIVGAGAAEAEAETARKSD